MPRLSDWQREAGEAVRREMWSISGPNRIVKVTASSETVRTHSGGYITIGRYLVGKTPLEIQRALGLPHGYLLFGARIYKFARLPGVGEYTYELTTEYPDGLAYNPAYSDSAYPPGSRSIHQWKIKEGAQISLDPRHLDLAPSARLAYDWLLT